MNLSSPTSKIDWRRCSLLVCILILAWSFIFYDYSRLTKDFRSVTALLSSVRFRAVDQNQQITAQFTEKKLFIKDTKTGEVHKELKIPTLHHVNYDTTIGKDMIIFTGRGTDQYNTRIHGGDLTLKSWLGFKRNLHINCTGYVREGTYPTE